MYALIRAKMHRGAAKDVANVRHGDAPFVHPPVAVGSWSNLHDIMIQRAGTPRRMPRPVNGEVELRADRGSWRSSTHFGGYGHEEGRISERFGPWVISA